jgi:TolA-binding protein
LKPDTYLIRTSYDTLQVGASYPRVWKGTISAPDLLCEVKAAEGAQREACRIFTQARDILLAQRRAEYAAARDAFSEILTKYPQSAYAPYASYLAAQSYFLMQADKTQHFAETADALQLFLRRFPNYPYYSDSARRIAAFALHRMGRDDAAREMLSQVPDGYYKDILLKRLSAPPNP